MFQSPFLLLLSVLLSSSSLCVYAVERSFYGMAYNPDGTQLPSCGASQTEVNADLLQIAQLTPRIRLYGADCDAASLVLSGIASQGLDLQVFLGIYVDGNNTVFERQLGEIKAAITTYGVDHVEGITVGNEFLLDQYSSIGSSSNAAAQAAFNQLVSYLNQTSGNSTELGLPKTIPIGTSEAGSPVTTSLCEKVDYLMVNIHAWFGSVLIAQAAAWTGEFYTKQAVAVCAAASNNATVYAGEAGWPTAGDTATSSVNGAESAASVTNLQTYVSEFVCSANTNGTRYFFFEYKDEPWKSIYDGVEEHWGLYNDNRTLKDGLTLPSCAITTTAFQNTSAASSASSGPSMTASASTSASASATTKASSGFRKRTSFLFFVATFTFCIFTFL